MRSHTELNYSVPFSWEHKPGVSKITHQEASTWPFSLALPPPPPCSSNRGRVSFDDSRSAAAFRAPSKSSFKKVVGYREEPDPFLVAYKKCIDDQYVPVKAKVAGDGKSRERSKMRRQQRQRIGAASFSCKYSCGVAGDNLVRMSQIPRHNIKGKDRDLKVYS